MSEYKWSRQSGILYEHETSALHRVPFSGSASDWVQILCDVIERCFDELDNNEFQHRFIIANRRNCKLLEILVEYDKCYLDTKLQNDTFKQVGFLRYIDVDILYDRAARDDTLLCVSLTSEGRITKEIKIL